MLVEKKQYTFDPAKFKGLDFLNGNPIEYVKKGDFVSESDPVGNFNYYLSNDPSIKLAIIQNRINAISIPYNGDIYIDNIHLSEHQEPIFIDFFERIFKPLQNTTAKTSRMTVIFRDQFFNRLFIFIK